MPGPLPPHCHSQPRGPETKRHSPSPGKTRGARNHRGLMASPEGPHAADGPQQTRSPARAHSPAHTCTFTHACPPQLPAHTLWGGNGVCPVEDGTGRVHLHASARKGPAQTLRPLPATGVSTGPPPGADRHGRSAAGHGHVHPAGAQPALAQPGRRGPESGTRLRSARFKMMPDAPPRARTRAGGISFSPFPPPCLHLL